ncbi:MAG: hypothetical protein V4446_06350 [Pseudomonadota bacterium]
MAVFVAAMYELKVYDKLPWHLTESARVILFVIVGGVVAEPFSRLLAWSITNIQGIRVFILHRRAIEGFWHVQTFETGNPNPIADGLARFEFVEEGESVELKVDIHKIADPEHGVPTRSHSELAMLAPHSLAYFNLFKYLVDNQEYEGVAVGHFAFQNSRFLPDRYDGRVIFFNGLIQRQIAVRVPHREVRRHKSKYGNEWQTSLLSTLAERKLC